MRDRITVVVTTRNSAATLDACLVSIRKQTASVELVVVDNFSTDATAQIAERYADRFERFGPERSRQRNHGARVGSGEWLLFLDSDMSLETDTVEECLSVSKSGSSAVIIPEISIGTGFWARCKALERSCYVGDNTIEAARWISRSLFDRLGGFDEELTGEEDWDLTVRVRRAGKSIGRTSTPLRHDEGHLRLAETMRAKYYYGLTMARYIRKHPADARSQLKFLRPAFFRHSRVLARQPILTTGMAILKAAEIAAGAAGTVVGYVADQQRASTVE